MNRFKESRVVWSPAKINLRLEVLGQRRDGYHDILSVMQKIDLCDRIDIHPADNGIQLKCEGADLPESEGNLVYEAARLLAEKAPKNCGARIRLEKRIPLAAGLGGGSSNAAAVLKALNEIWAIDLPEKELMHIGLKLGADVPFFLFGPEALAGGVGEILTPLPAPLPSWNYVLVNPGFSVSTKWAYQSIKMELTRQSTEININKIFENIFPVNRWLINDLEKPVILKYPVIKDIKEILMNMGAEGSMMSGSGPTVFGIFNTREKALCAAEVIRSNKNWYVYVTRKWLRNH